MRDARTQLGGPALASWSEEGLLRSARHVETRAMRAAAPVAPVRASPGPLAEQVDQLLFGEGFEVLAVEGGYARGQARRDGYVGWVALEALGEAGAEATHWVWSLRTHAYAEPSIRAVARGPYSLNTLVAVEAASGPWRLAAGAGWFPARHLGCVGDSLPDPARTARRYLGTPYLWGGRDSLGLDCSGLVQQALQAAGRACPRDADQQALLGSAVARADLARGDLVAWRGHIGMMLDSARLIHANAHHMAVAIEPLSRAIARIEAAGGGAPVAYRRIPSDRANT